MGMMWRVLEEARRRLVGDRRAAMTADQTVYIDCMICSTLPDDTEEYRPLILIEGEAEVENDGDEEGKETAIGSGRKCANGLAEAYLDKA